MDQPVDLGTALAKLDRDIAETELRLVELKTMRENIRPFFARYIGASNMPVGGVGQIDSFGSSEASSMADRVMRVFEDNPDAVLDFDAVIELLANQFGTIAKRDAVRNAIHYAVRRGKIHQERRGRFTLKDTSTPAGTGVDVNEESNSVGSSRMEGGGREHGSTLLHDQGETALDAQLTIGRDGDRAPIGG